MLEGLHTIVDVLLSGIRTVKDLISSIPSVIGGITALLDFVPSWLRAGLLVVISLMVARAVLRLLP